MTQCFKLLDLQAIQRGGLAGQGRVQMSSGMIVRVNFMRSKTDSQTLFPFPAATKGQGNSWVPVVEFATPDLLKTWQAAVMDAARDRIAELDTAKGDNYADF